MFSIIKELLKVAIIGIKPEKSTEKAQNRIIGFELFLKLILICSHILYNITIVLGSSIKDMLTGGEKLRVIDTNNPEV